MLLSAKKLETITVSDLQQFIDFEVLESKTLDYKRDLDIQNITQNETKKEFLADVSAFANAAGGDIIFGIAENDGRAVELTGIRVESPDKAKQAIVGLLSNGIEPRVFGIEIKEVRLAEDEDRYIFIIRVPKSWNAPHRIVGRGADNKFYSRNSAGKYPMEIGEIKQMFLLADTVGEKIKALREHRISKILNNTGQIPLTEGFKIVLHVIPFSSLESSTQIDISGFKYFVTGLKPLLLNVNSYRHNFDGYLSFDDRGPEEKGQAYIQLFRNGIIEAVTVSTVRDGQLYLMPFEKDVLNRLQEYLYFYQQNQVSPPFIVYYSLLGVKGMKVSHSRLEAPVDRDNLLMPDIMIQSFDENIAKTMKTAFDIVWQACDCGCSTNYNNDGEWIGEDYKIQGVYS